MTMTDQEARRMADEIQRWDPTITIGMSSLGMGPGEPHPWVELAAKTGRALGVVLDYCEDLERRIAELEGDRSAGS
jgi:hypothetical protein